MRICILNDNFYRASGVAQVIQRLAASSCFQEVDLYLSGSSSFRGRSVAGQELSIVAADRYRHFSLMTSGAELPGELFRFAKWLRSIRCDLVHVHHRRLAVFANLISAYSGVPVVFTGHLTFSRAAWFFYGAPRRLTGVSPSVVSYLEQATRTKKAQLIYNPFPFSKARVRVPATMPKKVVSIGRLETVKGHRVLIEAWALLKNAGLDAQLEIHGEGPLRSSLEELVRAKGLEGQVTLCGFSAGLEKRLDEFAFNVLVSETEGFPNVVVEAAARSVPTLLNDVAGSRDTLPESLALPNGLRYGDVGQLSRALQVWISSPDRVADDGVRFHDHLETLCSPQIISRQYVELYKEIIGLEQPAPSPVG